ncbi:MAG: hypothetical protein HYV36_00085 [Lentisphaerae bacterium]|nr:hypothetical protein [Lentisphaerota bacterium]
MNLLYAKYNRHRLPPFQIETSIWQDDGRKFILKKALTAEAVPHLQRLYKETTPIRTSLRGDRLRLPDVTVVGEQILRFDFVEGRSLDALLGDAFQKRDKAQFADIVTNYFSLLSSAFATVPTPVWSEDMQQVFGLSSVDELAGLAPFLMPALADPLFENILIDGGKHYLIDHEWVFAGCLPVSFILFRSLFYFYEKNKEFGLEAWMPLTGLLERFALAPETTSRYQNMDEAFQAYVFSRERCYRYRDRYRKHITTLPWLFELIEHQRQVVRKYHGEIVHLRQEISAMKATRGWQFTQGISRLVDACFPPGARRRRVLECLLQRILTFF